MNWYLQVATVAFVIATVVYYMRSVVRERIVIVGIVII